jgi:hypothetical protein
LDNRRQERQKPLIQVPYGISAARMGDGMLLLSTRHDFSDPDMAPTY